MRILHSSSPSLSFSFSSIFFPTALPRPAYLKPFSATALRSSGKTQHHVVIVRSSAATLPVLSFSGDQVGEVLLNLRSAPPDTARSVVHRGIVAEQQNQRRGTASTLTRGEVSGGGKKPYPQKKTGRARRGSQRSPLRRGGGVIFGPKPKDWSIKINRKERRLAISTAISSAAASADAFVVEDFADQFEAEPKTKELIAAMRRWGLDPKEKSMFLLTEVPDNVSLSCRNIGTLKMVTPRTLNLFDILDSVKLVFTKSALGYLNAMYGENVADIEEEQDEEKQEDSKVVLDAAAGQ
ncbi:50S ribosomal protein L4, chloroplastic [Apostasia shenzhenica]|uniref:Large ribosomal subunit protein uL4c n=1 Tax=Apostasia shenzhenica TaxID=1088818 RepID=A0A2I0AJZ6_9ASPA|nr:50S ribosomal protein L4, chloroplastic [Apostasia shenzhenica]